MRRDYEGHCNIGASRRAAARGRGRLFALGAMLALIAIPLCGPVPAWSGDDRGRERQQRDQERQQREQERRQRDQERQARAQAQAQAAAERQARAAAAAAQKAAIDDNNDDDPPDTADTNDSPKAARNGANAKQDAKQDKGDGNKKTADGKKDDKKADRDDDGADAPDIDVTPTNLVDFVKKLSKTASQPAVAQGNGKSQGTGGAINSAGTPKIAARDFSLLNLASFKHREIVASNLSSVSVAKVKALGFKTLASLVAPGQGTVERLRVPPGMSESAALELLKGEAPEAALGPNHIYHIYPASETEPLERAGAQSYASGPGCVGDHCFARELLRWRSALSHCASRVRVGLIDTSFDTTHPAFEGRKFSVGNFIGNGLPPQGDWHGTAVLSVLAGSSTDAAPGLVPDAEFLLASTFGADDTGNAAADTIAVLKSLAWLDALKVDIVNMSFSGPPNEQIERAIGAMAAKGVIFVAAAGNHGADGPASYPAAYRQVIAVTAITKDKQSYRHANRGDYVDVAAPGVAIWTALPNAQHGYRTGTSFAAPYVTGLIAAMPMARKGVTDKFDLLSRVNFQDLGPPGRDPIYGQGLPVAPERCNEVGGVASLPWTEESRRMSVGGPKPSETGSTVSRPASR